MHIKIFWIIQAIPSFCEHMKGHKLTMYTSEKQNVIHMPKDSLRIILHHF